jgi:TolB-like protein/DNA-binding winged helix-turn-helix (wHTH) protein/tetratricopeptide (TPR) repeat protein
VDGRVPHVIYEFGDFQLDAMRRVLLHADGTEVPLTPRVFDALLYFVQHRGALLEKSALLAALWPNLVVEESNLTQTVYTLRRALGETPDTHCFIVTVPGRGYRFVAEVSTRELPATPATPDRAQVTAGGKPLHLAHRPVLAAVAAGIALVVAAIAVLTWSGQSSAPPPSGALVSLAVMPIVNLTGDSSQEYFVDGLTEELIGTLASVDGLKVPARSSLFVYKGKSVDVRQVGRELGVTHVLEGSIRSSSKRIRMNAQLIDARTGAHVWSESYDRELADLFALQDEITVAIVHALAPSVGSTRFAFVSRPRPTTDVEAYRMWLRAARYEPSEEGLRRGMELLRGAIARDPNFANAWLGMAVAYATSLGYGYQLPGAVSEFEQAAERAVSLAPDSPDAHAAQGLLYLARGKWQQADEHYRATMMRFPTATHRISHAMDLVAGTGRVNEAMRVVEREQKASPGEASVLMQLAVLYAMRNRDQEALRCLEAAHALGVPEDLPPMHAIRASAERRAGRHVEAAQEAAPGLPDGLRIAGSEKLLERVYRGFGEPAHRAAALEAVGRFVQAIESRREHSYPYAMLIYAMDWYAQLGAIDEAYGLADRWIDHYHRTGLVGVPFTLFLWSDEMRPFRRDPRFSHFAAQLGYVEYWERNGPPEGCSLQQSQVSCE